MKKILLPMLGVIWFAFLTMNTSLAQQNGFIRCATTEQDAILRANNPNLGTLDDMEQMLAPIIKQKKEGNPNAHIVNGVYIIPVVVHVIHNGEAVGVGDNISYARIQSQIETLNDDFRRRAGTNGFNTNPVGADTQIEFRLAQRRPNGTAFAETGVNRIDRTAQGWTPDGGGYYETSFIDGTIKPYTTVTQGYDGGVYMSYWCIPRIRSGANTGILGYAQFPTTTLGGLDCTPQSSTTDGVVMATGTVGGQTTPSTAAPYNLGRTATHEIGHWLGLRHIWGDGGCGVDDFCADTPTTGAPNFGCPAGTNSCTDTPVDFPDMVENYMDYTEDACMNVFTNDQKIRMRTILETTRFSLINSDAAIPPNADDAGVLAILSPISDVCSSTVTPSIRVKNYGTNTLTSLTIEYGIDGAFSETQAFTGLNVAQNATVDLVLNNITGVALGNHTFEARSTLPNGVADPFTDSDLSNSTFTLGTGALPIVADFEEATFPPSSWERQNPNNDCDLWVADASPTLIGSNGVRTKAVLLRHHTYSPNSGQQDILVSPSINLNGAVNANLDFDVAYRRRNTSGTRDETLRIEVSTDCGLTWNTVTPIYNKTGAALATVATASTTAFTPTAANQWRRESVSLNTYVNNSIKVRFVTTNANGNNLYIDNVRIYDSRPEVQFVATTATTTESSVSGTIDCRGYQDFTIPVSISAAPISAVTVNVAATGGTMNAQDYTLQTPTLTFAAASIASQNVVVRVFNDDAVEVAETLQLTLSVSANANLGTNTVHTLTVNDDDDILSPKVLFSENFESRAVGAVSGGWTITDAAAGGSNNWVFGENGEMTGNRSAYITNNTTTRVLAYATGSTSRRRLVSPSINTVGATNLQLSFDFKVVGESSFGTTVYDYGRLMYSTSPTGPYTSITGPTDGTSNGNTTNAVPFFDKPNSTAYTVTLPAACQNQANLYLVWRWDNDGSAGTNPPFTIDNIVLTGVLQYPVENTLTSEQVYLGANSTVYVISSTNKVIAKLENNTAHDYGCTTVAIDRVGTGAVDYATAGAANGATQKSFRITPTNPSTQDIGVTLYYTNAEKTGWETATGLSWINNAKMQRTGGAVSAITPATPTANGTTNSDHVITPSAYLTTEHAVEATINNGFGNGNASGGLAIAFTPSVTPAVNLSVSSNTGSEADATVITVTATIANAVTGDQTVNVAVTGTDITAGDYTLSNSTITILDGQTTGSVTFTVVDDALLENTETATLTISSPSSGIILGATTTQNITITDNDDNDICTDAATVTCGATYTGTTVGKGNDNPAFCGTGSGTGGGVWYKIAGNDQRVTIATCGAGTNFDTKLRVYSGSCGTLTCVTGNDDGCGSASTVTFDAITGTDYYILVHGFSSNEGNYTMSVSCAPLPVSVNLTVSSNAGSEAAASVITVTATAASAVTGDQTVNLGVTGTGITAGDYTLSSPTITILDGQTTGTVTFTVVDDALVEGTETAILTISTPSAGLVLGTPTTQNIVITDNDAQAAFTSSQIITYINTDVVFTDTSIGANAWDWNFGAGANTATANTQGPHTVSYSTAGVKTITLNVNGGTTGTLTTTRTITVLPNRATPYTLADGGNFEVNPTDFVAENIAGTNWERGSSFVTDKDGVVSGANAWVTGLVGNYVANSNSNLYTPNFNFSAAGTYTLSFQTKHNFENGYDGMIVEYSTNKGTSWTKLGSATTGAAWYNSTSSGSLFGSSVPIMSNINSNYVTKSLDVSSLAGNADIAFRVVFKSDGSGQRAGAAIDDFTIIFTPLGNPAVNLSVISNTGSEAAPSAITVTATAASAVTGDQTVNLGVTGTGITAGDYTLSSPTITILDGQTTGSVTFTVVDDALVEGVETATLTISSPSAGITLGTTTTQDITITDNDNYTIAITEFINNTTANDATDEWIELYNYGANPIDIQNWRLKDEDIDDDIITASSYSIAAGEYLILAKNKSAFETQWLGGVVNAKVIEVTGLTLANGADEIVITDNLDNVVWSLAFANDETDGRATFYSESTYTTNIWGNTTTPGVVRNGNDVTTGTLGYESNNFTTDVLARTSTTGDIGSPLNIALGSPEINLTGNGVSIPSGTTATGTTNNTDLGQTIGTGISKNFAIQNTGNAALNVSSITSSNTEFVISNAPSSFIVNDQRFFTVTFIPTVSGVQTSTITINSDDADEATYTFVVAGEGICPITTAISASTTTVLSNQVGSIRVESQLGVTYQLQNASNGNSNVGNAVAGTGGMIYLQTNPLTATTDFRVEAIRGLDCGSQILNTVTITVSGSATGYGYTQTQINTCTPSSNVADIDVSLTGSSYLWSNATTNQNLNDVTDGIYSLTIDGSTTLPVIVGSPVEWEKPIRSTITNEGRLKANGTYPWNSEAAATSKAKLASGENGGFTLVVEDMATISNVMIGLAEPNNEAIYTSLGNCFYVTESGVLYFYWNNLSNNITSATTVSVGDRITILREGSSIKYYHNSDLVYTDTQAANATKELVVDIALIAGTSPQVWFSKCTNSNFEVNYVQNTVDACNTGAGEGQITLSPQGIAPYTYNWTNGAAAISNPTGMQTGLTTVEVTDVNSYQKTLPVIIGNPVNWTSLQNTSATQGQLFALGFSDYSNAGAISSTGMGSNTDGGITYIYTPNQGGYMIGLSAQNTDPNWTSLEYSTYVEGTTLFMYQGTSVVSSVEDIASQDRISIIRVGSEIIYYQNSKELHRLAVDPTVDLFVDATVASGQTPVIYASWCTAPTTNLGLTYNLTSVDDCTTGANEGAISLQGNGGSAAYTYTWNGGNTDNPRTGLSRGLYEITVASAGSASLVSPIIVGGFANWGNLTANTTQIAGTLTATTATDWTTPEGGLSTNRLAASTDGGISFIVPTTGLSNYQIGLSSTTSTDTNWDNIGYSVWINSQNTVRIYESGVDRGATQAVTAGDRISIIRKSGNVEYYVNSTLIYTNTTGTVTQELAADISIIDGTSPAVFASFCNTGFRVPNKVQANETTTENGLEEDTFGIYPNPSTGIFNVRFGTILSADTQVTIFDGIGRSIKTQTFKKGSQKFSIDLKNQPKGMYLIHFNQNGATYSKSIIIE